MGKKFSLKDIRASGADVNQFCRFTIDSSLESLQDGLVTFVGQGEFAVEMIAYCCEQMDLYEVLMYERKPEFLGNDTFTNLSYMNGRLIEEFEKPISAFFETREEAIGLYFSLISEHNHF